MRFTVIGEIPSVNVLRSLLEHPNVGYTSSSNGTYKVFLEETDQPYIIVDGIDCDLERYIVNSITSLTSTPVLLQRQDGVQSDKEIRIAFPNGSEALSKAVENGILRGILKTTKHEHRNKPKDKWYRLRNAKIWIGIIVGILLLAFSIKSFAQEPGIKKVGTVASVPLKSNAALAVRNIQFQQDKLLLRMKNLELEHESVRQQVVDYSRQINETVVDASKDQGIDIQKFILDLDTLDFVPRPVK